MSELIPFPGAAGAEEHADAETNRKNGLYRWADGLLRRLGLVDRVSQATSFEELHKITFDVDAVEVALAIQEALHAASGRKADCFIGLGARPDSIAAGHLLHGSRLRRPLRGRTALGGCGWCRSWPTRHVRS